MKKLKKHLIYAIAIMFAIPLLFAGCKKDNEQENEETVVEKPTVITPFLGIVSFKSPQTWQVGKQEWSDAVMATGCKKDEYFGWSRYTGEICEDCRQNQGYGDMYSWTAVKLYGKYLCPNGWRVPTEEDFITLAKTLGATQNSTNDTVLRDAYLNTWGGAYSGRCSEMGEIYEQGSRAFYWSSSEDSEDFSGIATYFASNGDVIAVGLAEKTYAFAVRCVREVATK